MGLMAGRLRPAAAAYSNHREAIPRCHINCDAVITSYNHVYTGKQEAYCIRGSTHIVRRHIGHIV
jgi:hypothetical protein